MRRMRLSRGQRILLISFFAVCLLALAAAQGLNNLNRALISMAEAQARQLVADELYSALKYVTDTSLSYTDFVDVRFDGAGRVNMVSANAMRMDALAAEAVASAQARLEALREKGVRLPLGAALGSSVFSGAGPQVRFPIVPVGTVTTNFVTEFQGAGINQTRHTISLEAVASVQIVIPTGTAPITVHAKIPVAESILVGEVPESYIQVPGVGDSLNFAP